MDQGKPVAGKIPVAVIIASYILIIAGVMYAASFVTSLLLAVFISIICYVPVVWLQKKKVPNGLAVAIVFIAIILLFIGLGGIIGTSLSSFSENLSNYEKNLDAMGNSVLHFLNQEGFNITTYKISGFLDPSKIMNITANILGQLGGFMGNTLTILFLALFLLLEVESVNLKIRTIMLENVSSIGYMDKIIKNIRHYLSIKTATSLMTGVLIWIGLKIVGVDYAIIWALIAFLLNYIPTIGSIIAGIPPVLFALIELGFGGVIWTLAIFITVNMVIGNLVEPRMMGKGMGLSTFVVFLSLIFWGFVLGTVGMFLSVPMTMTIKIMLEQHPDTKWMAVLLGTSQDAEQLAESNKKTE